MIFDTASLNAALKAQLADAQVPADYTHAFVFLATPTGGIKGAYTTRLGSIWELDTVFSVDMHGAFDGGVLLKAVWK